jgi:hypothetical protein
VQAQSVEEALENVHAEQHASRYGGEDGKALKENKGAQGKGRKGMNGQALEKIES